jgi:hypothetical protein
MTGQFDVSDVVHLIFFFWEIRIGMGAISVTGKNINIKQKNKKKTPRRHLTAGCLLVYLKQNASTFTICGTY